MSITVMGERPRKEVAMTQESKVLEPLDMEVTTIAMSIRLALINSQRLDSPERLTSIREAAEEHQVLAETVHGLVADELWSILRLLDRMQRIDADEQVRRVRVQLLTLAQRPL